MARAATRVMATLTKASEAVVAVEVAEVPLPFSQLAAS